MQSAFWYAKCFLVCKVLSGMQSAFWYAKCFLVCKVLSGMQSAKNFLVNLYGYVWDFACSFLSVLSLSRSFLSLLLRLLQCLKRQQPETLPASMHLHFSF
jgi:hypothetical protein